ncbi:MAG TPA: chemotaxis protein CheD [Methylomirabilota bacterium]|nr:chemotaxis protein CheD [Methylomirabilota bacterium]
MSLRAEMTIHIGGVHATRQPMVLKTVVGSCVAVCLMDPVTHVGGMNHFLLPGPSRSDDPYDPARFGVHAMDLLIGAMQKAGAERRRLHAKVFGGGHVLLLPANVESVPERNIRFIEEFMATEAIPVVSRDLGGYLPRRIHFCTDTGKVFVKRLGQQTLRQTRTEESAHLKALGRTTRRFGEVTLFDA